MIFKKYGTSYHSVDPNFESKALNEIGFRKDKERVVPVEEFQGAYEHLTTHELVAEDGDHDCSFVGLERESNFSKSSRW